MGSLTVKLEENGGTSWYTFYKSGHQSDQWLKGMGNINTNHNYRVRDIRFVLRVLERFLLGSLTLEGIRQGVKLTPLPSTFWL